MKFHRFAPRERALRLGCAPRHRWLVRSREDATMQVSVIRLADASGNAFVEETKSTEQSADPVSEVV